MKVSQLGRQALPYQMILPTFIVIGGILIYPLIYSLILSFFKYQPRVNEFFFTGLANYVNLIFDSEFRLSLYNTFIFLAIALSAEFALGFALALLADSINFRGKATLMILLFLPFFIAPTLAGLNWRWLLNGELGLVNQILSLLHIEKKMWLVLPPLPMISVMLVDIWEYTPFMILLLYAGLQSLPHDPYEAATIDGANNWQKIWYLTVPLLRPVIGIALMLRIIDIFRIFDTIYVMTQGGPGNTTQLASLYIYKVAFRFKQLGYAAAASYVVLFFSVLFILPILIYMEKRI